MKGCTKDFSDKKLEKHLKSLDRKTSNRINEMIDNESRSQDFLSLDSDICSESHPTDDSHKDCWRKAGHKGKHYCIECGESWETPQPITPRVKN